MVEEVLKKRKEENQNALEEESTEVECWRLGRGEGEVGKGTAVHSIAQQDNYGLQ